MARQAPAFWLTRGWIAWLLWPLSLLFQLLAGLRRHAFSQHWLKPWQSPVPVVVVGNITVGGAGKTPLTIALANHLSAQGIAVGLINSGYGGGSAHWPLPVDADTAASAAGDEAVLLARRCDAPVVAGRDRVAAVQRLLAEWPVDLLLCDDGLQHYRLARDAEIAVVSVSQGVGNGFCLPAGPLREPLERLQQVDMVVYSGAQRQRHGYYLQADEMLTSVADRNARRSIASLAGQTIHVVAGIAQPDNFFAALRERGIDVVEHAFPDHHRFSRQELDFGDDRITVMTEKDAVKCLSMGLSDAWYLSVSAILDPPVTDAFDQLVAQLLPAAREATS